MLNEYNVQQTTNLLNYKYLINLYNEFQWVKEIKNFTAIWKYALIEFYSESSGLTFGFESKTYSDILVEINGIQRKLIEFTCIFLRY